jgi:hypothetical protein
MVACLPSKCKSEFKHQYHKKSTGSITHNNNNKILKAASSMTALSSSTSLYVTVRNAHIYSPDTHKSGEGITAHTAWKFRQPRCPSPEWVRTTFLQQITQQWKWTNCTWYGPSSKYYIGVYQLNESNTWYDSIWWNSREGKSLRKPNSQKTNSWYQKRNKL